MREQLNALSFDIEDWFHIVEVKAVDNPEEWPRLSAKFSLVERYTDRILRICDEGKVKATFFVLGWIAERHPRLVKRIAEAGHEIGSHSFWHRKVYELSPDVFAEDIADSIAAIRAAAGQDVEIRGFRAPSFSITPGTEWAFDVLLDNGFTYDASLFPVSRGHGGFACAPGPHSRVTPGGRAIAELPMSVASIGLGPLRIRTCFSGGGYLRLLPSFMIDQGVSAETAARRPTVVYLHPRDFARDCPRVKMPLHRRFKCYVGLGTTERKLRHLLNTYRWGTCHQVLEQSVLARAHIPSGGLR
jgi:polysaccharide deacetylase family protein (PEP-CTERM system associated)